MEKSYNRAVIKVELLHIVKSNKYEVRWIVFVFFLYSNMAFVEKSLKPSRLNNDIFHRLVAIDITFVAILAIFLKNELNFNEDTSTFIYHSFLVLLYTR